MSELAGGTKIEWADYTFNPWWGCERVSPACAHCYADTFAKRIGQKELWTKSGEHGFRFLSDAYWRKPLDWARTAPAVLGRRPRVFCASMADVFEERDEIAAARFRLLSLILDTPELDWLVLTKRPEFARDWLQRAFTQATVYDTPLPLNLWLGVSIENSRFSWRADVLREIPAAVRFISAEPLLGSLFTTRTQRAGARVAVSAGGTDTGPSYPRTSAPLELTGIDWVIIGGESGAKARPFHLEHAVELVDACRDVGATVSVFFKQMGSAPHLNGARLRNTASAKGGALDDIPVYLRIREHPESPSPPVPRAEAA